MGTALASEGKKLVFRIRFLLEVQQATGPTLVLAPHSHEVELLANTDVNAAALRTSDQISLLDLLWFFRYHIGIYRQLECPHRCRGVK